MLNIKEVLTYVLNGVKNKEPRFEILDDEHILCSKTGVKFHLYDDDCKITRGGVVVFNRADIYFRNEEKPILFELKKLITDPDVVAEKLANYPIMIAEARKAFSDLFEFPQPLIDKEPAAEENTIPYKG